MNDLFLKILRLAVCSNRSTNEKNVISLEECKMLQSEARKQAVDGVLLDGLSQVLVKDDPHCQKLKLQWIASALQLERRNTLTNQCVRKVTDFFREGGYRSCVLKRQVVAFLYPNPKRRHRFMGRWRKE